MLRRGRARDTRRRPDAAPEQAGFRSCLLEVYVPRYGPELEEFLDGRPVYCRIEAARMFSFQMTSPAP